MLVKFIILILGMLVIATITAVHYVAFDLWTTGPYLGAAVVTLFTLLVDLVIMDAIMDDES